MMSAVAMVTGALGREWKRKGCWKENEDDHCWCGVKNEGKRYKGQRWQGDQPSVWDGLYQTSYRETNTNTPLSLLYFPIVPSLFFSPHPLIHLPLIINLIKSCICLSIHNLALDVVSPVIVCICGVRGTRSTPLCAESRHPVHFLLSLSSLKMSLKCK